MIRKGARCFLNTKGNYWRHKFIKRIADLPSAEILHPSPSARLKVMLCSVCIFLTCVFEEAMI